MCRNDPPTYVFATQLMDESKHKLKIKLGDVTATSGIETLIIVMHIALVWPSRPVSLVKLLIPPIPLPGTGSDHIWAALHTHPLARGVYAFVKAMLALATKLAGRVQVMDKAASNDRLHAHDQEVTKEADHHSLLTGYSRYVGVEIIVFQSNC